jgi:protease IV
MSNLFYRILNVTLKLASVIVVVVAFYYASNFVVSLGGGSSSSYSDEFAESSDESWESNCNVLLITLHGDLYTYIPEGGEGGFLGSGDDAVSSDKITHQLEEAEKDGGIRAIILEIDSAGGYPVAGEEVANAFKQAKKPTVALVRQGGLSAAYWAATGANRIFASKNSDVGSIGVTMSYLDNVAKNEKEGNGFISLSAGKYKDMGNPDKSLTAEEKALFRRDLEITHENFMQAISENRNIPLQEVRAIADGSSVMGERAKSLKLIDEIGGLPEVKTYLSEKIGTKEIEICEYN